mgnify:CR=1 FL=1
MSRITKALDKLRQKCTAEGAHPDGTGTADILECIAEHYAGGGGKPVVVDIIAQDVGSEGWTQPQFITDMETDEMVNIGKAMLKDLSYETPVAIRVFESEGATEADFCPHAIKSYITDAGAQLWFPIGVTNNSKLVCTGLLKLYYTKSDGWDVIVEDKYA